MAPRKQGKIFLQLEVDFDEDEKVRRLTRYGRDARGCRDLLVTMWRYCKKNMSDGHIPLEEVGIMVYPDPPKHGLRDADRLVAVELAERTDTGYYLPGFLKRNKSKAQIESEREDRAGDAARDGRFGNHTKWHTQRGVTKPGCEFCTSGDDRPDPITDIGSTREDVSGSDRSEYIGQSTENTVLNSVDLVGGSSVPREPQAHPQAEPSPNCPAHPTGTTDPCGPCGRAKAALADWRAEERCRQSIATSQQAHERARLVRAAVDRCTLCDHDGRRPVPDGLGPVCDHIHRQPGALARARASVAQPESRTA